MVAESFKVSCRVLLKGLSDSLFFSDWTPKEPNVSASTLSHIVKGVVESFFFSNEPFVDFKS
jgi:hypothetical protein